MTDIEQLRSDGNSKYQTGNYAGALISYTEALILDPHSAPLLCNRAAALIKLDSMDDASKDLEAALAVQSDYVPAICRLGFLKLFQGNTPAALRYYVQAVKAISQQPNQLDGFTGELKHAIKMTEQRAKQQGYSQDYIDGIVTDDVRTILDSYHSRNHQRTTVDVPMSDADAVPPPITTAGPFAAGGGPSVVQGPNGFSASFHVGADQANTLQDAISQLTGQPRTVGQSRPVRPFNINQAVGPAARAQVATNPGEHTTVIHMTSSTPPVVESATTNQQNDQPPEEMTEVSTEDAVPSASNPASQPATHPSTNSESSTTSRASQIHRSVTDFIQQRVSSGESLSGADFARGIASVVAGQVGNAVTNNPAGAQFVRQLGGMASTFLNAAGQGQESTPNRASQSSNPNDLPEQSDLD